MSTPEHSQLPWSTIKGTITDADGNYVNTDFLSNRRLIVSAVNSHAALLVAAKEMLSAIATRDIGSFTWESRAAKALKAAIAAAEEPAP